MLRAELRVAGRMGGQGFGLWWTFVHTHPYTHPPLHTHTEPSDSVMRGLMLCGKKMEPSSRRFPIRSVVCSVAS